MSTINTQRIQTLSAGLSTSELQAHIDKISDTYVCITDDKTRLSTPWPEPINDAQVAVITAPTHTALGKRLGYEFESSLLVGKTRRRRPMGMPSDATASSYFAVDVPNDGAMLIRLSILRELGGLKRHLDPNNALLDFAVRAQESGYHCMSDIRMTLYRAPGYAEPCQSDEVHFSELRSEADWRKLLRGECRRVQHLNVDLIITGRGTNADAIIKAAGYPIERIYWATEEVIPEHLNVQRCNETAERVLRRALLERRERPIAIIDLATRPLVADWLLSLMEEGAERHDVAITTLGCDGIAGRVAAADAQATLFFAKRIPVSLVPMTSDNATAFVSSLCAAMPGNGIGIRQTADQIFRAKVLEEPIFVMPALTAPTSAHVSIISLSAGVEDVNALTSSRLRANTREPHDFTVIVRRSYQDIIKRLRSDSGINVLVDASDTHGAEKLSLALSQASGEYIALLRDDVVIPEGWLEPLEEAMKRLPHAGIVAPRVSHGTGSQAAEGDRFANTAEFQIAAQRRRTEHPRTATIVHSLNMPIFLIRREIIERVGGFDPAFGTSEFGILDLCIRVQAAGYAIVIAEDAIVHRIKPELMAQTTAETAVEQNYAKLFARKWQLKRESLLRPNLAQIAASELGQAQMYVPFPPKKDLEPVATMRSTSPSMGETENERAVFLLPISGEASWQRASRLIKKYQKTFTVVDNVSLAIGCSDGIDLATAARRVERIIRDLNIAEENSADVIVADARDRDRWLKLLPDGPRLLLVEDPALVKFARVKDLSPSGLRQSLKTSGKEA